MVRYKYYLLDEKNERKGKIIATSPSNAGKKAINKQGSGTVRIYNPKLNKTYIYEGKIVELDTPIERKVKNSQGQEQIFQITKYAEVKKIKEEKHKEPLFREIDNIVKK